MIFDKGLQHILCQLGKPAPLVYLELINSDFPSVKLLLRCRLLGLISQEELSHQCFQV